MLVAFIILVVFIVSYISIRVFMHTSRFGSLATHGALNIIQHSPNYRDGKFQNLSITPELAEGVTYPAVLREFIFGKSKRAKPSVTIPSVKTDLHALDRNENVLVWFGHSSYFLQVDGKRILVDPVLSGSASPVSFTTNSFPGSNVYSADDIPDVDYLFISHDHWDHLDYNTVLKLQSRIGKEITGIGTGAHFRRWGFNADMIIERDWNSEIDLGNGFTVITTPARHFSGRGLKRNQAIWTSFVLLTPQHKIYLGGDSGYDTHFKQIGDAYGPFDLAILECGQYNEAWKYIHMLPHQIPQAAQDLRTAKLMPVHWAKFTLGNHAWDEPIIKVSEFAAQQDLPLVTPMIGEPVYLDKPQTFKQWWAGLD